MKTLSLLIEPDIAGGQAKDQSASALRVAVIRRGINIEPDIVHVGKITAQLADHLVPGAFRAEPGAFHHFDFLNSGRCSRTMSRFELNPPVATTTVLL